MTAARTAVVLCSFACHEGATGGPCGGGQTCLQSLKYVHTEHAEPHRCAYPWGCKGVAGGQHSSTGIACILTGANRPMHCVFSGQGAVRL